MREIIFRGKRIDNGEWVYGCLTRYSKEMSYIIVDLVENEVYEVHTETVGQYTGLKDKNGKEVYEGDMVKKHNRLYVVQYWKGQLMVGWHLKTVSTKDTEYLDCFLDILEIIGNIHDNPELIQE